MSIIILLFLTIVKANIFDFFQSQFTGQKQQPESAEIEKLNLNCDSYLCPDTNTCVESPSHCPCPFPSSQLRCFLPNGNYLCISKPNGNGYDGQDNWKVDAKDDNIRDCGWVSRAYKGLI
ncbi:long chronological lifespan protein 2 [[Candida] jaroonii]|uniref:Long chronological lifespan protein 2 n=1 Tax=[Candida] jaroonii TaxID=467808 RepID=A0ACA9Y8T7_9ASCO|nr:long chronological lifespan protein 2 [[Candida] jaroonii]